MEYRRLILFHEEDDVMIEQARRAIEQDPIVKIVIHDPSSLVVHDGPLSVRIWHDKEPCVRDEAAEIATLFAADRPDRDLIASCDRRFVIACDPYPDEDHVNTLILIESNLEQLVNGVTFNPLSGQFT